MVRVLGNSSERIKISDLNDVIYYRQKKEYTDQEFESSRDLKREIEKGRITVLEKYQNRTSVGDPTPQVINSEDVKRAVSELMSGISKPGLDISDIKKALSEVPMTPEVKQVDSQEIKKIMMEVLSECKPESKPADIAAFLPLIIDTLRQEMSRMQLTSSHGIKSSTPTFIGSEYVPNVSTSDMKSNIKIEERVSVGDMNSSLEALKKLQGLK